MFKRFYLSIYMTEENIVVSEFNQGILVNESTTSIVKSLNLLCDINKKIFEQNENIISILKYCLTKLDLKLMDSVIMFLIIPVEFDYLLHNNKIVNDILQKVSHVKKIYKLENIISAQVGFLNWTNADLQRRFLIYSEDIKTYIYFMWAGGLVDYIYIEKRVDEIDKYDILNGINSISKKLSEDIPDSFKKHPTINQFKHTWIQPIDNNIYTIAPERMQYFWGQTIDNYNLVYLDYVDNIVIEGANKVMKMVMDKQIKEK